MNWKGILWWLALGLAVWLSTSLLSGMIFGLLKADASTSIVISALGGMAVPFLFFFKFLHIISACLIIPLVAWLFLARRFPQLEASKSQLTLSLAVFALFFGAVVWWFFPLDRSLAIWAAMFTILSIAIPRFLTDRLSHGKFIA